MLVYNAGQCINSRIKIDHKIYHFIADSLLKMRSLRYTGRSQFTPLSSFSVISTKIRVLNINCEHIVSSLFLVTRPIWINANLIYLFIFQFLYFRSCSPWICISSLLQSQIWKIGRTYDAGDVPNTFARVGIEYQTIEIGISWAIFV